MTDHATDALAYLLAGRSYGKTLLLSQPKETTMSRPIGLDDVYEIMRSEGIRSAGSNPRAPSARIARRIVQLASGVPVKWVEGPPVRPQWAESIAATSWPSPSAQVIPPFEAPERPSEPVAVAAPEPAAVQVLRKLADDRDKCVAQAHSALTEREARLADLKAALAYAEEDLDHHKTVVAAAEAELADVKAALGKLGADVDG